VAGHDDRHPQQPGDDEHCSGHSERAGSHRHRGEAVTVDHRPDPEGEQHGDEDAQHEPPDHAPFGGEQAQPGKNGAGDGEEDSSPKVVRRIESSPGL
jgi:hypothetical protein